MSSAMNNNVSSSLTHVPKGISYANAAKKALSMPTKGVSQNPLNGLFDVSLWDTNEKGEELIHIYDPRSQLYLYTINSVTGVKTCKQ
jgi:hypothetical protein